MEQLNFSKFITDDVNVNVTLTAPSSYIYNSKQKQYCIGDNLGRVHVFNATNPEKCESFIASEVKYLFLVTFTRFLKIYFSF